MNQIQAGAARLDYPVTLFRNWYASVTFEIPIYQNLLD